MDLKPCPACGETKVVQNRPGSSVCCEGCYMLGPMNDSTGSKWNALPRRGDVLHNIEVACPTASPTQRQRYKEAALTALAGYTVQPDGGTNEDLAAQVGGLADALIAEDGAHEEKNHG